ncbi:LysR family transcriptional regulator [Pseudoduganella umbonata]|uniref:DNA-binding transcriptional LysR family regulator n=1 Tax=Pseudoduganella umbonata TaxID=864828 RepID=A0A4P8HMI3_9BURK|nr:LysR family transcriptional regulator [Pseudoduganella umbonata]MBB3219562.1 DNA-binding transcriptional LysR family regulator [Pseudoduganella umbonata]QCP09634.1 LysR family transcriptional regulator [Pseudoduganella umbonata]
MRFNRLDLNLLVALDALLSEKSITRAAGRLNLSQSATSGVLARLREYFKDELLVPVGRTLILTPLATSLCDPVRKVLLQIQATIDIRPEFDPQTASRAFRILASDYISTVLLGDLGQRFASDAPNITLDVLPTTSSPIDLLERAEVDLIVLPRKFIAETHPVQVLFEETYTCIAWTGNTQVGETLTLDQYMALGHVSSRFGAAVTSFEEWFLKISGYDRRIEVTTTNFTSIPHFVIGTNRIATMHTRLARTLARYYPIRLLPPPLDIPALEMCMQWNHFLDRDPSHIWLRSVLADIARADPFGNPSGKPGFTMQREQGQDDEQAPALAACS